MPKKGVFGDKAKPMDPMRGVVNSMGSPPEVTIRKAKSGGFIVTCRDDDYRHADHAASSLAAAVKIAKEHLGDSGEED